MDGLQVRVGDAERRVVDERLQQAVGDGRLTLHEYEERAGQTWAARTRAELERVTADLPSAAPAPPPVGRSRPRRAVAVLSGDRLTGPVLPGQGVQAYAVLGGAVLDLRRDDLPAQVQVRAVAVMGGIEVLVPRGVHVELSGAALMGGRDARVDPPRPGAPMVSVTAYALMGGVEVTHGDAPPDGSVSLTKAPASHGSQPVVRQGRRPHRHSLRNTLVAGVVVGAAAFGLSGVAGADDAAVFGSREVRVHAGQSVDVANVFGSVKVIVDDGVSVSSGGTVVFGSEECQACSDGTPVTGPGATVHARGAFGSVEIVHASDAQNDAND